MINGTERILVCCGGKCAGNGAREVADAIAEELGMRGLEGALAVEVVRVGCMGECDQGPIVRLMPRDVAYYRVSAKHAAAIVGSLEGKPVRKLLYKKKRQHFEKLSDNPFFALQQRVVLERIGAIDPLSVEDYVTNGGYSSLTAIRDMSPSAILSALEESGFRIKREEPAFPAPTWLEAGKRAPKRIVCDVGLNGLDDPIGLALAEGSPHVVIEGMAVAMRAFSASDGLFRMRPEDAAGCDAIRRAIADARSAGVFESAPECPGLEIVPFCPDGERAQAASTLHIDAEALAALPSLFGGRIGGEKPKATKAFALGGKAKHEGLVEVALGTTLRALVCKIGGGVSGDRPLKALRIGGPTGVFLPEPLVDLPVASEAFALHGIPMDSGSITVLDDRSCIVKTLCNDIERLCVWVKEANSPNLESLEEAHALLGKLCAGDGMPGDIEALRDAGLAICGASTNLLERRAAESLLCALERFRNEFEAHAVEKRCPAGSCAQLTQFVISADACAGCDACTNACPAKAIVGEQREPHAINHEKCISCGTCRDVCRFHAILAERRSFTP